MRAMILAAGFGTRLASLGLGLPKPLFPVLNVPLIRWAVSFLRGHGITEIVVNLHHRGERIQQELGDGADAGVRIQYSVEKDEILGTGGGIRHALPLLGEETFVVMNGKIVTDLDLQAALDRHRESGADATLVVRPDPHARQWGAVSVDAGGQVRGLLGDPDPLPPGLTDYMFTGIHVLEPAFVRRLLREGPACIVQQGYRPALRGERGKVCLAAHVHTGYFWDHSTPARWLAGNLNLLTGHSPDGTPSAARFPPPGADAYLRIGQSASSRAPADPNALVAPDARVAPDPFIAPDARVAPDVRVAPDAFVAPDATVGPHCLLGPGARIEARSRVGPAVVLGPGSRVAPGVSVDHALVYAGAQVTQSISSAIVTPDGTVHAVDLGEAGPRSGPALGTSREGS